jgi:hypothetical protein
MPNNSTPSSSMPIQPMQGQDPLAQLRDIHLPDPVGFWPLAPGWWLLSLLIILAVIAIGYYLRKRFIRNRYRRQALAHFNNLKLQQLSPQEQLQQINYLLKQTAQAAHSEIDVANLSGKKWLGFLDQSGNTSDFSNGVGQVLEEGPYKPTTTDFNSSELLTLTQRWIKQHRMVKGNH